MQKQNYMITAEEVAESMGISLGYAYKLLRKLNKELADSFKFFIRKFSGLHKTHQHNAGSHSSGKDKEM